VRLCRLQVYNFRNLANVQLTFPEGPCLFVGDNGQGKTNLLEAIFVLSVFRSFRADSEIQMVRREAIEQGLGMAKVTAEIARNLGPLRLELAMVVREEGHVGKSVKVNGAPKRINEAVGAFLAVLFTANDLELISGSPAARRRYLDLLLSRLDPGYVLSRQRLSKVLLQRNYLLRQIKEGAARPEEMEFWDQCLAQEAARMIWARAQTVASLQSLVASAYTTLGEGEDIELHYVPKLGAAGNDALHQGPDALAEAFRLDLERLRPQETAAGMTLLGPQRDDIEITWKGVPAAGYVSRGQERILALALRVAEALYLKEAKGDSPLLLLDDVVSELDVRRRKRLLDILSRYEQVLATATDLQSFPPELVASSSIYMVSKGEVLPVSPAKGQQPDLPEP